jgi:beta-glucosidase
VSPLQGVINRAGPGVKVTYNDGSDPASAAAVAKASSVAIVVASQYEIEGTDVQCLTLECPNAYGDQDSLIQQVAAANRRTIVVLETGGPVLTPWRSQTKALLEAWYPGGQGGAAIARVLFGDVNPSGHLPISFPRSASQDPTAGDPNSYPGVANLETYNEGVFVGYRWLDAHQMSPAFPFGLGLSYTRFTYAGLRVKPGAAGALVSFTVKNVGRRAGATVPQLYLGLPSAPGARQPPAQLKGFTKLILAPGQVARVRFRVGSRALSYWDTRVSGWRIAPGCYRVMVGRSERDLPLRGAFTRGPARCR